VTRELIQNDYLPVAAGSKKDLEVEREGSQLRFMHRGGSVLDIPVDRFLSAPRRALDDVSAATDHWGAFRGFTFWCVLMAFPIALYTLAFGWLRLVVGLVLQERLAEVCTAGACLVLGLGILAHYILSREPAPHPDAIAQRYVHKIGKSRRPPSKRCTNTISISAIFPAMPNCCSPLTPKCAIGSAGLWRKVAAGGLCRTSAPFGGPAPQRAYHGAGGFGPAQRPIRGASSPEISAGFAGVV